MVWDARSGAEITTVESHSQDVDFLMASQELNRIFSLDSSGMLNEFPEEFDPGAPPVFVKPDLYENQPPSNLVSSFNKACCSLQSEYGRRDLGFLKRRAFDWKGISFFGPGRHHCT